MASFRRLGSALILHLAGKDSILFIREISSRIGTTEHAWLCSREVTTLQQNLEFVRFYFSSGGSPFATNSMHFVADDEGGSAARGYEGERGWKVGGGGWMGSE